MSGRAAHLSTSEGLKNNKKNSVSAAGLQDADGDVGVDFEGDPLVDDDDLDSVKDELMPAASFLSDKRTRPDDEPESGRLSGGDAPVTQSEFCTVVLHLVHCLNNKVHLVSSCNNNISYNNHR